MKKLIGLLVLGGLFLSRCEEGVDIQHQPFVTQPIIFCVIDPNDTVHSILVERMFSGVQPPALTGKISDSLFFKEVKVNVTLSNAYGTKQVTIEPKCVEVDVATQGYFGYKKRYLFQFGKNLSPRLPNGLINSKQLSIQVEVPGLPPTTASTEIISPPLIYSPNPSQQYIYIIPDNPLRVQWSGGYWNELDIEFEIMEKYKDSLVTQTLTLQKNNDIHINGKYYEVRIPYDLVVQELDKMLKVDEHIIRRYFGEVRFIINTGLSDYAKYIQYLGGINDFNETPFSNIENGIGLLTSRSSIDKGPFYLDQASRIYFANDSILKRFSFIEY